MPDQVLVDLVVDALEREATADGWILDGFPQTLAQAQLLESQFTHAPDRMPGEAIKALQAVVWLDVSDEEVLMRALGHVKDPETGTRYHLYHNPPPVDTHSLGLNKRLVANFARESGTLKEQLLKFEQDAAPLLAWLGDANTCVRKKKQVE